MNSLEMVRSSALPHELELQLLVGNCIEALIQVSLKGGALDDTTEAILVQTAARFREGANILTGSSRTLAQSASGLGLVDATRRALGGSGQVYQELQHTADQLEDIAKSGLGGRDIQPLIEKLVRLHEALGATRETAPDEVRGLTRIA